jgi:hypothetical protein
MSLFREALIYILSSLLRKQESIWIEQMDTTRLRRCDKQFRASLARSSSCDGFDRVSKPAHPTRHR